MPMKMKNMKGIDLFCTSPASTAICSSTDLRSMVRNGSKPLHHHRLADHYKKTFSSNLYSSSYHYSSPNSRSLAAPCISELPFTPRPKPSPRRKSSADVSDLRKNVRDKFIHTKSNRSPPRGHSSRYLLGDSPFLDSLHDHGPTSEKCLAMVPSTPVVRSEERDFTRLRSLMDAEKENAKKKTMIKSCEKKERVTNYDDYRHSMRQSSMGHHQSALVRSASSSASSRGQAITTTTLSTDPALLCSRDQVVVLRVSLHCKGCEGKLRKYLSKMEGVRSFSIDLETKKVTVIGNVTPSGVLTSISKVKNAQLWPSPMSSSSTSSSSSSNSSASDFNY